MLSGPPETATATTGRASKPPIRSSAFANSPRVSAAADMGDSTAEAFLLRAGAALDRGARAGEIVIELGQRDAGVLLLIGAGQRHAELQQLVGRLAAFRIALLALGKGARRLDKPAACVIGLAEPVLGVAGPRILRVLLDKGLARRLGGGIVRLLQQTEGIVVLLAGRAARQAPLALRGPAAGAGGVGL